MYSSIHGIVDRIFSEKPYVNPKAVSLSLSEIVK